MRCCWFIKDIFRSNQLKVPFSHRLLNSAYCCCFRYSWETHIISYWNGNRFSRGYEHNNNGVINVVLLIFARPRGNKCANSKARLWVFIHIVLCCETKILFFTYTHTHIYRFKHVFVSQSILLVSAKSGVRYCSGTLSSPCPCVVIVLYKHYL